MIALNLAERGWLPDAVVRFGIRRLLKARLQQQKALAQENRAAIPSFYERLRSEPIAVQTQDANRQHYEMPAAMFRYILGHRMKYSCALFPTGTESLDQAEDAMLALTCARARLEDGMTILELGCGWGSLSLWMAEHYPNSRIVAVSNSASQREFIEQEAARRNLKQLRVITSNVIDFDPLEQFDRIVSVEMFEHMRNYALLLERVSQWLTSTGKLFVHIFCHCEFGYLFEESRGTDWMAKHFFSGGMMPSVDIFSYFQDHCTVTEQWTVNGNHYAETCDAWLANQDLKRKEIKCVLGNHLPKELVDLQYERWRIFFMACAELFRFNGGDEWLIGHFLLDKKA